MLHLCRCTSLEVLGTEYKPGCWLMTGKTLTQLGTSLPTFGRLDDILVVEGDALFVINSVMTADFLHHYCGYLISVCQNLYLFMKPSQMKCHLRFNVQHTHVGLVLKPKTDLYAFYSCL